MRTARRLGFPTFYFALALAVVCALAPVRAASASDAVVPGDFPTIAKAVAEARDKDGDGVVSILVRAGVVHDPVVITRSSLSLVGETGAVLLGGLVISDASDVSVEGFLIAPGFDSDGIVAVGTTRLRLVGNVVGEARHGIWIDGGTDPVLVDNEAKSCARIGIRVGGGAENAFLAKNRAHDNRRHGIDVLGASDAVLVGNSSEDNLGHGFRIGKSVRTKLVENVAIGNAMTGFLVARSAVTHLEGNVSKGNGTSGIRLVEATGAVVARNVSTANLEYGVRVGASEGIDFDAMPGASEAPGDNMLDGNKLGPMGRD